MEKRPVDIIVVTGGPCAGKSTILSIARQWLENRGLRVAVLSETATELINAGFPPNPGEWEDLLGFQLHLLQYMRSRENRYMDMLRDADTDKPLVLLCDRGALDALAYVGRVPFLSVVEECGEDLHSLRERYKAVIHLVTAAEGAEEYYTLENNTARTESPELARELDGRTLAAWRGHQHHMIIDNSTDFEAKKLRTLQAFARILHMPEPYEIERKWRLDNFHRSMIPANAVAVEIVQTYLKAPLGSEHRVRMRTVDGSSSYYKTKKLPTYSSKKRIEKEFPITRSEYETLLAQIDPDRLPIRKTRHCWEYDKRIIELDIFADVVRDGIHLVTPEVEIPTEDAVVNLPPDWQAVEVTNDHDYKNSSIARLLKQGQAARLVHIPSLTPRA